MTDYLGKAARYAGLAAGVGFILWFLVSGRASTMLSCSASRDTVVVVVDRDRPIHDTAWVKMKPVVVTKEDTRRIDSVIAEVHRREEDLAYKDSLITKLLMPVEGEREFVVRRPNLYLSERIGAVSRPLDGMIEIERSIDSLSFTCRTDTVEIPPNYVPWVIGSVLAGAAAAIWIEHR